MPKAVFTIVSSNYLHYARTLLQGVAIHHPDCARFCFLVDRDASHASAYPDEFTVVPLDELGLPEPRRFAFRYSILELNTAVKPWAFAWLFEHGCSDAVYLDPDIRLYSPLDEVFRLLADAADIVLTPHLLAPMTDEKTPTELHIRVAGSYNLGFCALAASANVRAFLAWWKAKLVDRCVVDFAAGIFVDQSWIDLVPGMFRRVTILRHAGCNVAYWNLAQRALVREAAGWTVEGEPLVFFHFSGFDPEAPEPFSKHQDRFTLDTLGPAKELALDYAEALIANDARSLRAIPYGYGVFDDGTKIPDFFREAYRRDERLRESMGDDPFGHPSVLTTLLPARRPGHLAITRAMQSMWDARSEIRTAFPLTNDESVVHFYEWFENTAQAHVSPSVIAAHAAIRASIAQMFAAGPAQVARDVDPPIDAGRRRSRLRDAVYAALLDRRRDPDGGTRDAAGSASSDAPPTVARDLATPRGWFPQEADVATSGIWAAPDAGLPCVVDGDPVLVIEGAYDARYIEQQTGSPTSELTIAIDGHRVASIRLATSGPFSLQARLSSASLQRRVDELCFRSSSHFVPKAIGLGEDARQLAWRAHRIVLGDTVLLDAMRSPPIASLDALRLIDGVNLIGYLATESGIGESLRAFARACNAVGLRCSAYDVGHQSSNRQNDRSLRDLAIDPTIHRVNVLHVNADQTPATLAELPSSHREADITIGYWHWEQPELPMSFLSSFEGLTEVWVPSGFVRDAVSSIAPVPVFKVPHAIGFTVPAGMDRAHFGLPRDRFLVLVMYDFDSYHVRKNPLAAIDAFRRACGSRSDCALVVKTVNGHRHADARDELQDALAGLPEVHRIDGYLTRNEVHALENACDCFVSLHRSEGFGLGLAEMMYLGKPVLGTGWSGNMEFMNFMNSFPIGFELKPLERSVGVYEAAQSWAEADVEHASQVLRAVIDDADLRQRVGARAARDMRRYFSASYIGSRYLKRLAVLPLRSAAPIARVRPTTRLAA